ncbi:hypothetical protein KGV55_00395 [Candidatus Gracilibacteria bacterium]|nr:hypothetical protein [Candidatus Gracilibacteria bacterium]
MKKIFLLLAIFLPLSFASASTAPTEINNDAGVQAQTLAATPTEMPNDFVKTTGLIKSIEKVGSRKSKKFIATVEYSVEGMDTRLTSTTQLLSVPFIGTFNKEGDEIEILYSKSIPALIKTPLGDLFDKYGMYFLIAIGVIVSLGAVTKAVRKK